MNMYNRLSNKYKFCRFKHMQNNFSTVTNLCLYSKKRFKRLRRIQDRESDEDEEQQPGEERDAIANELFEGGSGDVSNTIIFIFMFCDTRHRVFALTALFHSFVSFLFHIIIFFMLLSNC